MRALVVYESMYGNTREVADAVALGLSASMHVQTAEVGAAPSSLDDVDLLVVGGPTHAFSMSRPSTRADAARQADHPVISSGPGIREWLDTVSAVRAGASASAFDTRVARPRLPGSAARRARARLRRAGFRVVTPATSFWVAGMQGPLRDGELERAQQWGRVLAERLVSIGGSTN